MLTIHTERLILAPTPLDALRARLRRDDFVADVPITDTDNAARGVLKQRREGRPPATPSTLRVHFPPEWPGDALDLFPLWIAQQESGADPGEWDGGIMIDRAEGVAVGQMGFKGPPDEAGAVELGYGVNRSYQGRGYATEMARALTAWALARPGVARVTAACLEDNGASIRVLEKSGFRRTGRRADEEGPLILWERTR